MPISKAHQITDTRRYPKTLLRCFIRPCDYLHVGKRLARERMGWFEGHVYEGDSTTKRLQFRGGFIGPCSVVSLVV